MVEKKAPSIKPQLVKAYDQQVEKYTKASLSMVDAIQFTIKQGIAQRGHSCNKGTKRENGNLTMLVDILASYSLDLKDHVSSSARNARYLSPKIQTVSMVI